MRSLRNPIRATVLVALSVLVAAACSGSSSAQPDKPTTSFHYLVNPLEPGTGFLQLGSNRYPFDGVICATGRLKSDPTWSRRIFGVYANFHVGGKLAAISLTRYYSDPKSKAPSIPTITDTALVRMQGADQVLGLKAQRARIVGHTTWTDVNDPQAHGPLITKKGDRYEANGHFGDPAGTQSAANGKATGTIGEIAARCPSGDAATTTTSPTTSTPPSTSPTTSAAG